MSSNHLLGAGALAVAAIAATAAQAQGQSRAEFVQLGRASAAIHKPASGPAPHIAILVTHRTANNLNNIACREMAQRGFLGVCFNTRFVNNEAAVRSEEITLDVKAAVECSVEIAGFTMRLQQIHRERRDANSRKEVADVDLPEHAEVGQCSARAGT